MVRKKEAEEMISNNTKMLWMLWSQIEMKKKGNVIVQPNPFLVKKYLDRTITRSIVSYKDEEIELAVNEVVQGVLNNERKQIKDSPIKPSKS
ncbi:hypothetical protein EVAR_74099_1 [Eumeta japonica]|uniref:Uncharacterized protein n=1 Tax=Eumeta variegata TaxID=151549 RepID=A0A4C1SLI3_EUMVA|nr:hypothetical protein EVAR_74099_1 [Eumeta japonica]